MFKNRENNSENTPEKSSTNFFDQQLTKLKQPTIFLTQPSAWSRGILWTILGITTFTILGSIIFELETVVAVTGELEPKEGLKAVQTNVSCDVEAVLVKDGDQVEQGQVLVSCNKQNSDSQLTSLKQNLESLQQENELYRDVISSNNSEKYSYLASNLPPEILGLLKTRDTLLKENELYQAMLNGDNSNLTPEQLERMRTTKDELESRIKSQTLEIDKLETQLKQIDIQLANAENQVVTAQNNLIIAEENLKTEETLLEKYKNLVEEGTLSEVQYITQEQKVRKIEGEVGTKKAEVETQKANVNRLIEQREVIKSQIEQARETLNNTKAADQQNLQNKIAANKQSIDQIDTQLTNKIIANDRQISQIESQISQTEKDLEDRNIKAPVAGKIDKLKVSERSVVGNGETIMEIVPSGDFVAKVFIPNKDRGKVKENMPVDLRIDSYDFTEYGDIPGELVEIGKDAQEPTQIHQFSHFIGKIELDLEKQNQFIQQNGDLESGMSVNANIKTGKRRIISIFISSFASIFDGLKQD